MVRRSSLVPQVFLLMALTVAASCGAQALSTKSSFSEFSDVLQWDGEFRLQHADSLFVVLPAVTVTPTGAFIVADLVENWIRRYGPDGHVRGMMEIGDLRRGHLDPLAFALESGSDVIGYSRLGGFTAFDSTGATIRDANTGLARLYAGLLANDTTVLLAGVLPGAARGPLIHVWDLRRDSIAESFFNVPLHESRLDVAYAFSGSTALAARGDSIAATFARADTLYLFRLDGQMLSKVRIPFVDFRHVAEPPPAQTDPAAFVRWRDSYSSVSQVFWAEDGTFFIQYFDMIGVEPRWGLLHMNREGDLLFDVADTPRLLALLEHDQLLFEGPGDKPGEWRIAKLRPSR
jgi:hypothetical protein